MASWVEGGQDGGFRFLNIGMHYAKLWAIQGFKLVEMKGMHCRHLYWTPQSYAATHSHPQSSQAAIWTLGCSYGSTLCYKKKAASKSRPLKCTVACFECDTLELMYYCIHCEKSKLLSWVVRLVSVEPVTHIYQCICLFMKSIANGMWIIDICLWCCRNH